MEELKLQLKVKGIKIQWAESMWPVVVAWGTVVPLVWRDMWALLNDSKHIIMHTETNFSPISADLLSLQVAQMPKINIVDDNRWTAR